MNLEKITRCLLAFISIQALILGSCRPELRLPDGTFANTAVEGEPEIVLKQGHYQSITNSADKSIVEEVGSFVVNGNQITFSMEKGSDILLIACGETTVPYTYQWSYNQPTREVRFVNVNDPCDTRQSRRESGSWVLKTAVTTP